MRLAGWLVLWLVGAAAAQWTETLTANGSFELDANRDGQPDGWSPAVFRGQARVTWDRSLARSGVASVRIDDSKAAVGDAWDQNTGRLAQDGRPTCEPGRPYTAEAWVRTRLTAGEAKVVLAWFAGSSWLREDGSSPLRGEADWTRLTVTATAPAQATSVAVYLMANSTIGSVWFDDARCLPGDRSPADFQPLDLPLGAPPAEVGLAPDKLPAGPQVLRGVPFHLPADGRGVSLSRGPARVSLPVGRPAEVLYFLHTAVGAPEGQLAWTYRIRYADGATADLPVRVGQEVADWRRPAETAVAAVAWQGEQAGLTVLPWTNPRPRAPLAAIELDRPAGAGAVALLAVTAAAGPASLEARPPQLEATDKTGWYEWAFDASQPVLEEIDLSFLLDPPAGKHGFVRVGPEGRLVFADGTPARFCGTNVVGGGTCPPREEAEILAERLARYGCNLLRLHVPDGSWGGLIDYSTGGSRTLDPAALDRWDYLCAKLIERGIYLYFDLLDYRRFKPADGVRDADRLQVNWESSIKGASIFDERMIELQKEFATQLLTHRNPYTGRRYVDEPALVIQEITNENSLFYAHNPKLMLPSYVADLERRWNQWLLAEYGDRVRLAAAWAGPAGESALTAAEDPARGTVVLPLAHLYADLTGAPWTGEKSPPRCAAMARFLYDLERRYYTTMIEHLRGLGLKCPITGTNQDFCNASNRVNSLADAMSRNNYWLHPNVHSQPPRYSNRSVLRSKLFEESNPIAEVTSSTVAGKPMLVPEFNWPWPNEYRAEALPLMAAYGRLQDWDGLLYFTYGRTSERSLSYFGNQTDPVRWGQMPLAALLFLRGDVEPARTTVHVGVSLADTFATRRQRGRDWYSYYRTLPWLAKVRNVYFDEAYDGRADLVFSAGHTASGDYSRAGRAILVVDREGPGSGRFEAVGRAEGPEWPLRRFQAAAKAAGLPAAQRDEELGQVLRSDTGQLVLDRPRELFTVITPTSVVAVGSLEKAPELALGPVTLTSPMAFASVSVAALDGQPLDRSRKLLVTAVARAENTGQATGEGHRALLEAGRAPVLVEPVRARVTLGGRPLAGAWRLDEQGRRAGALPLVGATLDLADARSPWVLLTR